MTGCPYCQTKFQISDLFPKVTNFYFYDDDTSQVKKIKNIGIAAGAAFGGYAVFAFSTSVSS